MDTIIIKLCANDTSMLTSHVTKDDFFAYINQLFFRHNLLQFIETKFQKECCPEVDSTITHDLDSSDLREKRLAKFSHLADNLPIMEKPEPIKETPTVDPNMKYGGTLPIWAEMNPRTVELRKKLLESNKF